MIIAAIANQIPQHDYRADDVMICNGATELVNVDENGFRGSLAEFRRPALMPPQNVPI